MKRKSIGGPLLYELLMQHRPPAEHEALQAEVRRLAAEQRMPPNDIANALGLDHARVRELLAATQQEAAAIHRAHADARRDTRPRD